MSRQNNKKSESFHEIPSMNHRIFVWILLRDKIFENLKLGQIEVTIAV